MSSAAEHRAPAPRRPFFASSRLVAVVMMAALGACATSQHRRPRALGIAGAVAGLGGSVLWVAGESRTDPGNIPAIGLGIVAAGIVAMVAAGAWIASEVSCQVDPDCDDTEECREIPAPAGGVPYKQCVSR